MNRREFAKGGMAVVALTAFARRGDAKAQQAKEEKKMAGRAFDELIEARRSVHRYAPIEISREEISAIVGVPGHR